MGELASELPVSRPAVSQHLKVLKEAGLVSERRNGTRRLYRIEPRGVSALRAYFDQFWNEALDAFKDAVEREEERVSVEILEEVRKTIVVSAPVEKAWEVFTTRASTWWPVESHSIGGKEVTAVIGPDRMYERLPDGTEHTWGRVLVWDPPHRLVATWELPPGAEGQTELEIRFTPQGDSTVVELEHRGWERLGTIAAETRAKYDPGWDFVLGKYETAV